MLVSHFSEEIQAFEKCSVFLSCDVLRDVMHLKTLTIKFAPNGKCTNTDTSHGERHEKNVEYG